MTLRTLSLSPLAIAFYFNEARQGEVNLY